MKKNIELIRNTIIIFLGKASTQLISLLLLPIYTRYLNTSEYGTVDLIITYVTLLVPVVALQLEMAVFRFLIDSRDDEDEQEVIISSVATMLFFLIIIFVFIYLIGTSFFDYKYKYKYITIFNIVFMLMYSVSLQICRGVGKNIKYSIASSISGLTNVVFSIVFVIFLRFGGLGVLISSCIGNLFATIYIIVSLNTLKHIKIKKFSKEKSKELLAYSIPLIPDSVSWWIVNASDRTIISLILNVAENGIYAVANKFSSIYTGVFNVFSLSWNESLSVHINDEDAEQYINNVYGYVFRFFFSISMLIVCAMPIIGGIFITNDYNEAYLHIPILMFAAFINVLSTYISAIYFAKKKTKQIAKTSLIGALINIIINISLIKEIGLFAASISTLLSYLILFIYRYIDTKRYFKIDIFRRDKIVSIIYGIIVVWIYYLDNMILNYLNFIILLLFILIVNKNDIKKLILFIHKRVKLG